MLAPSSIVGCVLTVAGPPTTVYACVNGAGVEESTNGGQTWTSAGPGLPTEDVTGLAVNPSSGAIVATTSVGVFTKLGSAAWTGLDVACLPGVTASAPAIVSLGVGKGNAVIVGAAGSVYAHPL